MLPVSKLQYRATQKMESSDVLLRILPQFTGEFDEIANQHNEKAMDVFNAYVVFCAQKYMKNAHSSATSLPFCRHEISATSPPPPSSLDSFLLSSISRSPFSALSGHADIYSDSNDFVIGVRPGFEVDHALVPVLATEDTNVRES